MPSHHSPHRLCPRCARVCIIVGMAILYAAACITGGAAACAEAQELLSLRPAGVSPDEATRLHLAGPLRRGPLLEVELFQGHDDFHISQAGLSVAEQAMLHKPVAARDPVELYRVPIEYCHSFWPEHEPDRTVAQLCGEALFTDWQLLQSLSHNPLVIARDEVAAMNQDSARRNKRLALTAAYLYAHGGTAQAWEGAIDAFTSRSQYVTRDVAATVLSPHVMKRLPPQLIEVGDFAGEAAVDLRVTPGGAYDSVALVDDTLLLAAKRGMNAVVIAGRGRISDAKQAEHAAERLKTQGRLPEDFRVITGEHIRTISGSVLGIFLTERVLEGMPMNHTLKEIHRQGGLAYLVNPGEVGAASLLESLPFDGYLLQPGNFGLFRTLHLINDPRFADTPLLYGSNSPFAAGVGLPHTSVLLEPGAADPLHAGLASGQAYAAGGLYLPWMMLLATKPVAVYQRNLNRYFALNDAVSHQARRLLRSDYVTIRTSWDDEMRRLMSLSSTVPAIRDLYGDRRSPLRHTPRITFVAAEYGPCAVTYERAERTWWLSTRLQW